MLTGKTIILGVSGGISAYKSAEVLSRLKDQGADVWVTMTRSACQLVGPATFRTLSGNPVILDLFGPNLNSQPVPHVALAQKAGLFVVAPCTANIIGKLAHGLADDALTTLALACPAKFLLAPAMNTNMWDHPIVQENAQKLKSLGYRILGPAKGKLACGAEDIGRMVEPAEILSLIKYLLLAKEDLKGFKVLITAGATQEHIDPVRFISNRSSGKMGYALAQAAVDRGAEVILISGPSSLPPPAGVKFVPVTSAKEMREAVLKHQPESRVVIMAAAVADYQPKITYWQKLKKDKDDLSWEFCKTPDILEYLGAHKNGSYLVGFSLETENLIINAQEKMQRKNLDLMIANDISAFENDESEIKILHKNGQVEELPRASKQSLAHVILDKIKTAMAL